MISGELALLQGPMSDGLSFGPFGPFGNDRGSAKVSIGRRHIVVLDERLPLAFEATGHKIVLKQGAVLQSLVPALDLAFGFALSRQATSPRGVSVRWR